MAGLVGPVAFTAGWVTASLRQPGHAATEIQISGLAAHGARDPWIMVTGFLVLGGSLVVFGSALRQGLGGPVGPSPPSVPGNTDSPTKHSGPISPSDPTGFRRKGLATGLIQVAGVLTVAAGLLRRDHVLLTAGPQSWHNQAHNAVSAVIYVLLIVIPLLLARRMRGDRRWRGLPLPLSAAALATAVILVAFLAQTNGPSAGLLQRVGVSIPLAALVAVAARTLALSPG